MLTLEQYIELYESGLIFESVNIKGFTKWADKTVQLTKELYENAKNTANELDKKVQDILKNIYRDLGISDDEDEEENNNANNVPQQTQTNGGITKTGDEKSTDDANKKDDSTEEKLQQKLELPETKAKVTIINMAKTLSDKLQQNDNKILPAILDYLSMKGEDFLDSCLRIGLNAGNLKFDWIIETLLEGENLDAFITFIGYIKCIEGDENEVRQVLQYIGIEK